MAKVEDTSPLISIHVLIVNFNSAPLLEACLDSLLPENPSSVTIVDNGSSEDHAEAVTRFADADRRISVSLLGENRGFGPGVNEAAHRSPAGAQDIYWILNPDTIVMPGALRELQRAFEDEDAAVVSPIITTGPLDAQTLWYAGGTVDPSTGRCAHLMHGRAPDDAGEAPFSTAFITGAAMAIRVTSWRELGGFRPDLFLYWEDADLSLRAASAGMAMLVAPAAVIWHSEGGSSAGPGRSTTFYYWYSRNRIVVCGAEAHPVSIVFGRGLIETMRLLARPLVRERHDRFRKLAATVRGIVAGFRAHSNGPRE